MRYGLLGRNLTHSFSPRIHSSLGDYEYRLYNTEPEDLADFLKTGDFAGLNVTMPYKKAVIPYCSELTPQAKQIGAVNTIIRRPDGKLIGHNTDYFGFSSLLSANGIDVTGKKVLLLGSGGASATAKCVLEELEAKVVVISRTGENDYTNLHLHADAAYIVNTTPVGMYPDTGVSPVDLDAFPALEGVIDAIYNPARTELLMQAEKRGIAAINGLWMLVAQAKESAEWFTGSEISNSVIADIYRKLQAQMQNIILVGMPGSGKSTVGKALAQALGRRFIDADEALSQITGKSIPDILTTEGEDVFRKLEHQVLADLGKQSALVIATGGGCVTREDNYPLLHQNGIVIWLQRDIGQLSIDGRPLSINNNLEAMYAMRKSLYEAFSDMCVCNNGEIAETVNTVLSMTNLEV